MSLTLWIIWVWSIDLFNSIEISMVDDIIAKPKGGSFSQCMGPYLDNTLLLSVWLANNTLMFIFV